MPYNRLLAGTAATSLAEAALNLSLDSGEMNCCHFKLFHETRTECLLANLMPTLWQQPKKMCHFLTLARP